MRVSIITVSYNSAETIERTIDSVRSQTWSDIQHIVIDGGSTDGTPQIIERYRDSIKNYLSEPDNGIYDAMNKGMDLADGDIICFLNADDFYASPEIISNVVASMKQANCEALIGDVAFFKKNNPDRDIRRYKSSRFTPEKLSWGWMPAHPGLFLRSDVVQRVGRFKTDYQIAADFEYIIRVFHKTNITYVHIPDILVRMQVGGVSTNGLKSKIILNREVMRACKENNLNTSIWKIFSKYPVKLTEYII
jgi:glycosyltransferase involved in cell wall biosynthesis